MPAVSDEWEEIDESLEEMGEAVLTIGRASGSIDPKFLEEGLELADSGYGARNLEESDFRRLIRYKKRKDSSESQGEIDDDDLEEAFVKYASALKDMREDMETMRRNSERWRRNSWFWRIGSFILGVGLGVSIPVLI